MFGIQPRHNITDKAKLESLVKSMQDNGWVGAPVVIDGSVGNGMALTGTHRLEAAHLAGLNDVPVIKWEDVLSEAGIEDAQAWIEENVSDGDDLAERLSALLPEKITEKYGLDA